MPIDPEKDYINQRKWIAKLDGFRKQFESTRIKHEKETDPLTKELLYRNLFKLGEIVKYLDILRELHRRKDEMCAQAGHGGCYQSIEITGWNTNITKAQKYIDGLNNSDRPSRRKKEPRPKPRPVVKKPIPKLRDR